jgi:uncharacterized protein YoxC
VNVWSEVFLGVIACATLAMAIVQVGVLLAAGLLLRRLFRLVDDVERQTKPLFEQLNLIARDAARATALATAQVERADRMFADIAQRVEQILKAVQTCLRVVPTGGEGRALVSGVRAALRAFRDRRRARGRRSSGDGDDALFI